MRIDILSLFPQMFEPVLGTSILKRAAQAVAAQPGAKDQPSRGAVVSYHHFDIRDYAADKHNKVDKPPFGGGPGMVLQCQPVWDAVHAAEARQPELPATRILMSPQGVPLTQKLAEQLATRPRLLIIAGHYEGIDERVIEALREEQGETGHPGAGALGAGAPGAAGNPGVPGVGLLEVSIGDYVLTSGELAAMVLIDAVVRLLPGVLGDDASSHHESFSTAMGGQLDYPHYTRPATWMGREVPAILLSGNHAAIERWRLEQSRQRTRQRRPELEDDGSGGRE